jgi:PleD family two-component response regulator
LQLAVAFLLNIAVTVRVAPVEGSEALAAMRLLSNPHNAFIDHVTGLANRRELMRVLAD